MHSQPCYYLMSFQLQHSSSWVYLSAIGYSNNVKCKMDFPQMYTKNVEYNTVCVYSSGVKCLHLNKNNPGFFKCSIKSNWLSTLSIYLLIKSDVSGFLANLILINLALILQQVFVFKVNEGSYEKYIQVTKKSTTLAYFDHPSFITKMIRLQTMEHVYEFKRHFHRHLVVKS